MYLNFFKHLEKTIQQIETFKYLKGKNTLKFIVQNLFWPEKSLISHPVCADRFKKIVNPF